MFRSAEYTSHLAFRESFSMQFRKALEMTFMQLCLVLIVLSLQSAKACVIIGIISMHINVSSSTAYWGQIKYPDVNRIQVAFFGANRLGCRNYHLRKYIQYQIIPRKKNVFSFLFHHAASQK